MIRQVINGKLSDQPEAVYCVKDGKTVKGKKIYVVDKGKTHLVWEEKGTRSNPYRLYNTEDLLLIREHPSAYFVMMNDIKITASKAKYIEYFPLLWDVPFTGVLDGCGYQIKDGYKYGVDKSKCFKQRRDGVNLDNKYFCQFITVNDGIITRLRYRKQTVFDPATSHVDAYYYSAGLVGLNRGIIDQVSVDRCLKNGTYGYTAAVAGENEGTIQNSYSYIGEPQNKPLSTKMNAVGCNICVKNWGTIKNFYARRNLNYVTGNKVIFVGHNYKSGLISNCGGDNGDSSSQDVGSISGEGTVENVGYSDTHYHSMPDYKTIIY